MLVLGLVSLIAVLWWLIFLLPSIDLGLGFGGWLSAGIILAPAPPSTSVARSSEWEGSAGLTQLELPVE
jgi:hypothetical protein